MNVLLTVIILLMPLLILVTGLYRQSKWSLVIAAAPPLVASFWLAAGEIILLDWLLLGSRLGSNNITQWLLPASALIWTAGGLMHVFMHQADKNAARFRLFFLLAMSGNLLLLLAQDITTFYVGFALMGLAGYGLIFRRESTNARVAANTYLRWTIAGELLLFSGLLSLAQQTGSTNLPLQTDAQVSALTLALIISGFGIKIGLPGLHAWMPGTYSASNTVGSAVFSGAMANAGILGLLQFLPLQATGYTTAGLSLLAFGLLGVFYGVLLGLPQRRPKVILAYSSVSQLGTLAAMTGLALISPSLAPALVIAITIYAVHHGLTKAALFMALDGLPLARWRNPSIAILVILSLVMAGLPYTTGAVSKGLIKEAIHVHAWLVTLLAIASIATTLLMTRFLHASLRRPIAKSLPAQASGPGIALILLLTAHIAIYQAAPLPELTLHAIWPLAIAMLLVIGFALLPQEIHQAVQPAIPKGDLPKLATKALLRLIGRYPVDSILEGLQTRLNLDFSLSQSSATARHPSNKKEAGFSLPDNEVTQ